MGRKAELGLASFIVLALWADTAFLISLGACDEEECYAEVARLSTIGGCAWLVLAGALAVVLYRWRAWLSVRRQQTSVAMVAGLIVTGVVWWESAPSEATLEIVFSLLAFAAFAMLLAALGLVVATSVVGRAGRSLRRR